MQNVVRHPRHYCDGRVEPNTFYTDILVNYAWQPCPLTDEGSLLDVEVPQSQSNSLKLVMTYALGKT